MWDFQIFLQCFFSQDTAFIYVPPKLGIKSRKRKKHIYYIYIKHVVYIFIYIKRRLCIAEYRKKSKNDNEARHHDGSYVLASKATKTDWSWKKEAPWRTSLGKRCSWWVTWYFREEFYTSHIKLIIWLDRYI